MYTGILHLHSAMRYLILVGIIVTLVKAVTGLTQDKTFEKKDRTIPLLTMILMHLQLLMGIVLLFVSPRIEAAYANASNMMQVEALRFFGMEHLIGMIIAVALITMGQAKTKKDITAKAKYKGLLMFYGLALLIIFISIPWPFMRSFGTW
jgi:hypothetical protein